MHVDFHDKILSPDVASGSDILPCNKIDYYMPSTFSIVNVPLALGNIFNWTESIMSQSDGDAKNRYWGLIMDFWHCLIVMTYRNRALFRLELGYLSQHGLVDLESL